MIRISVPLMTVFATVAGLAAVSAAQTTERPDLLNKVMAASKKPGKTLSVAKWFSTSLRAA